MIEIVLTITVLVFVYAIFDKIALIGATLFAGEQARKAAKRQAEAVEKSSEHLIKEQQFLEELRRGFLEERQKLLESFGGLENLLNSYLESISEERGKIAEKLENLAKDPALIAGARLAVADALGLNRELSRRMLASLIGSGSVKGAGIARAMTAEEVRRQQETERQLADLARQEALNAFQLQQQASQLRESIIRERFQTNLALEEALANRALGMGSNIAGLAQAYASAQMQAQQFIAQQAAVSAQQLAQGIAGFAQAYQQQQMMNRYFDILRNNPYLAGVPTTPPIASNTNMGNPVNSPLMMGRFFAPPSYGMARQDFAPSPFGL